MPLPHFFKHTHIHIYIHIRTHTQNTHTHTHTHIHTHEQVALNPGAAHVSRRNFAFTRIIGPDCPTLLHRRHKNEVKTVIHFGFGQCMLHMAEIEFFTPYTRPGDSVLYAGAAPGTHTPQLIDMFSQLLFVLADSVPFLSRLHEDDCVCLRQECFTDELAHGGTRLSEHLLFACAVQEQQG